MLEQGRTCPCSSNSRDRFAPFAELEKLISAGLSDTRPVIDGEICSLDKKDARSLKICYFALEISVFSCVRFVDA
jgi:hypothetical protein